MEASGLSTEPTPAEKPCGFGEEEACTAVEHLPAAVLIGPEEQAHHQPAVSGAGFASCRGHRDHAAIGGQLQHRLTVLGAHQRKLLGRQSQIRRQAQRRQGIKRDAGGWAGGESHRRRPAEGFSVARLIWIAPAPRETPPHPAPPSAPVAVVCAGVGLRSRLSSHGPGRSWK